MKKCITRLPIVKKYLERKRYEQRLDIRKLSIKAKTKMMMDKYEKLQGYHMDINNPKTFTEKIQWYKLFYNGDNNLEQLVDKYLFKQYVKDKLGDGYTIPLIGEWTSVRQLKKDWEMLPEEFCLKSTVQSEGRYILFIHHKSTIKFDTIEKDLEKWLLFKNTLINSLCRAYNNAIPRIIAEQYMENISNQLYDFKIFCFNGQPYCIYVANEHFNKADYPITFYDLEWNKLEVKYGPHEVGDMPKPKHLDEMIEISKKLSQGFPFLRVDFFDTEEKLYVAELTLYPGGGYTKYEPESFNEKMGEMFVLPKENK